MRTTLRSISVVTLALALIAGSSKAAGEDAGPEVYFLPKDSTRPILDLINGARKSIDFATYVITDEAVARALIEARRRGVYVRILMDEEQAWRNKYSLFRELSQSIDVRVVPRMSGLMVNDFGIIDRAYVYTGSSFLLTSFKDSPKYGNYVIFRNASGLAERYEAEFQRLLRK